MNSPFKRHHVGHTWQERPSQRKRTAWQLKRRPTGWNNARPRNPWQLLYCTPCEPIFLNKKNEIWGAYVCQLLALRNVCQRMAKHAIFINHLYQKYITRAKGCQFWGPHKTCKSTFLEEKLHMDFGLPRPLQTTFELTSLKNDVTKYARWGYTNVTCPYLTKQTKNARITF